MANNGQSLTDLFDALEGLEIRLINNVLPLRQPLANTDWREKNLFLKAGNWADLKSSSESRLVLLEANIDLLKVEQNHINMILEKIQLHKQDLVSNYDQQKATIHYADIKVEINNSSETNKNKSHLRDSIDEMELLSPTRLINLLIDKVEYNTNILDYFFELTLSKISYNYFCVLTADLNLTPNNSYSGNPNNLYSYYRNKIEDKFSDLKIALSNPQSGGIGTDLSDFQDYLKDKIGTRFLASLNYLLDNSAGTYSDKRLISKISDLLMTSIGHYFGVRLMGWNYNWNSITNQHKGFVKKLETKTIDRINFSGKKRSINTILNNLNQYEGDDFLVEGIFGDFRIQTLGPNKAVSVGSLTHPTSGNKIGVLIPYFRLNSTGISDGAYCQVAGTLHKSHAENNNNPTIVIDRLSLSERSKTNFLAWIGKETRCIFEQTPHNIAIKYSFERGTKGMADIIKYDVIANKKNHFKPKKSI
jgi:hypothetical protein